ncbi:unnamed protein product [Diatraea saccharalis]|uniref:Uncharacterized protein n=1 Tax=Diatraea saccharalis TaxID=40085 RepID=A0A9N9QUD4_9NEOP|nr:unnamed protein product [Diatraea saccharalis]
MGRSCAGAHGESSAGGGAERGGLYETNVSARAALLRYLTQCICTTLFDVLNRISFLRSEEPVSYSKMQTSLVCLLVVVAAAVAAPQREGAAFTKEAIKQAQSTFLIPKDAEIQKVQEGIELAAYESIPGNQRINLFDILGDQVPSEVINNLQTQIDQVGRQ